MTSTAKAARERRTGEPLVVAVAVAWAVTLVVVRGEDAIAQSLSNVGLCLAALAAGAAGLRRGSRAREVAERRFWLLLGCGMTSWGLGQATWTWYESVLGQEVPFPSPADIGYLCLPPLAVAALLSLPLAAQSAAGKVRTVLDGLMVACSLFLCSWLLVLRYVFQTGQDSFLATAISLAYPVGDVVTITIVVTTWLRARRSPHRLPVSLPLVGTGLLAFAVADSGFTYETTAGTYASGSAIDLGWFTGFTLILLAGLRRSDQGAAVAPDGVDDPDGDEEAAGLPLGSFLPYAAVVAALLASTIEVWRTGQMGLVASWLRTLIMLLLVARQVLTIRENQILTRTLEERVHLRTAELRASRERFVALVQHSSDILTVIGQDGTVGYQSGSILRILGYRPEEVEGRSLFDLVPPEETARFRGALDDAASEHLRIHTVLTSWRHAQGHLCRVEVTMTNLLDNPHVGGLVLNTRDVTDRERLEEQLTSMAFSDPLTGLPNRALFKDRLQHALTRRTAGDRTVVVLFLDLDGFKSINDMLGHSAGDELLVEVADRLRAVVRAGDTVARFGGDEFAVLLEAACAADATDLARRINLVVQEPLELHGERVHVATSVGIAHVDDQARTAEQVLRNADLAMYQAKAAGAGGYAEFHPEMHAGLVERVRLERDLREAVDNGDFVLHYQPMISMRTGRITGLEALVRWQHRERGLVPPGAFIPVAEATGLIRVLGLWVLREACVQTVRWQREVAAVGPLRISVNVSPRQLMQNDFVNQVREILDETALPPRQLTLEMTESVLIDNRDETLATLMALRALGVRLAIDDFGTGYSSLSYLHRFPVDVLKIDRSFVERLSTGGDTALVSTILRLGQSLQLETVAEGIERPQQMLMLRRQGCTTGQGFHFSAPVPALTLTDLLIEQAGLIDPTEEITPA